jgi:hypothetical protein
MDLGRELVRRLGSKGANVALVLVKQAKQRIRTRGSDVGGYARLWADTATIKVWKGRGKNRRQVDLPHYRAGGVPLADTGNLLQSLNGTIQEIPNGVRLFLRGPLYAVFQHHGFKTSGGNVIPFTRAAARGGARKWIKQLEGDAKSKAEGKQKQAMERKEFMYAKNGVTVPARPIFAMPSTAKAELARAIARALGAR